MPEAWLTRNRGPLWDEYALWLSEREHRPIRQLSCPEQGELGGVEWDCGRGRSVNFIHPAALAILAPDLSLEPGDGPIRIKITLGAIE